VRDRHLPRDGEAVVGPVKPNAPAPRAPEGLCIVVCFSYYPKAVTAANSLEQVSRLPSFACYRASERGRNSAMSR